jgi:hypothetical protein
MIMIFTNNDFYHSNTTNKKIKCLKTAHGGRGIIGVLIRIINIVKKVLNKNNTKNISPNNVSENIM